MVASVWPVPDWNSAESYHIGMKRFGANRPGGRLHAGCDLYAPVGSEVLAIAPGSILVYGDFIGGTKEIQIAHPGIGLVRYCEIKPVADLKFGAPIKAGQVIGFVQQIKEITNTMLHIELYDHSDAKLMSEPLTPPPAKRTVAISGPYIRRKDLKDITPLLDSLVHYYKPKWNR